MPDKTGRFTPQEAKFAAAYAATGNPTAAAHLAGYKHSQPRGSALMQRPAVQAEILRIQTERLTNELVPLAIDCLAGILKNEKAPAGARVTAAKVVLDRGFGSADGQRKELHELSAAELDEAIARLRREAAERAKPVIEGKSEPSVFD